VVLEQKAEKPGEGEGKGVKEKDPRKTVHCMVWGHQRRLKGCRSDNKERHVLREKKNGVGPGKN